MWTGLGMVQEGADLVGRFRREDVLKLAGLLLDLGFTVEGKAIGEQALCQPMTSNDVSRLLTAAVG